MASRHLDWLKQAERDLRHAENARASADHEWSCFAAQQGAEKAVKAIFQARGAEAWGHSVTQLLQALPEPDRPPADLLDRAKDLDRHYIPTRYPSGFDAGAPGDYYTDAHSRKAIEDGRAILEYCQGLLARP